MRRLILWASAVAIAGLTVACEGRGNSPLSSLTSPSANSNATSSSDSANVQALKAQTAAACGMSVQQDGDATLVTVGSGPPPGSPPPPLSAGGQSDGPVTSGPGDSGTHGTPAEGAQVALVGQVDAVAGSCPALTLTIGGTTIRTDTTTSFSGAACGSINSGDRLGAFGASQADGSVAASCVAGL